MSQRERVIVPEGRVFASEGVIDPGGWGRHLRFHHLCLWPQTDHKYVPIKCMKDLAYFVIHNAIATLRTPKCHEMLVHGKFFLLQCKIPGLINAH